MYPNSNCNDCPPCPSTITPLPLPDLSGLCGDQYNAACVIYTGSDIKCLGIESGMTFLEVLTIFNNVLPLCDCCEKVPQDCTWTWGPWSPCECYYEDEVLICGRESRTKIIVNPPLNGGTGCGPLVEYRPCTLSEVCFSFSSYMCESAPDPTQILTSPAGILNEKPYYLLEFTCGAPDLYVWYNNVTLLWHITPVLGTMDALYQTLNNSSNYLPISNNTTQIWSNCESCNDFLISSQTSTCPAVKMCFQYTILITNSGGDNPELFTYYTSVAPVYLGNLGFPEYWWTITTPDYVYNMKVIYDVVEGWQHYIQVETSYILGYTLDIDTFNPVSTLLAQWTSSGPGIFAMVSSTLGGACVQPPDVDCVWTCSGFGPCNAGCTQTQTCTITTPASGNGICLPSPATQQSCCEPSCGQPISPVVVISGANVLVTFAAISGAIGYTLTYSFTGGNPVSLTSSLPSFSFPWVCGIIYNGSITTNCGTLTSVPTTFTIEIPSCPDPQFCNGEALSFIMGNIATPRISMVKIDNSAGDLNTAYPVLNFSGPPSGATTNIYTAELANDGIFIGTLAGYAASDQAGSYLSGGIIKLYCNSSSASFFGQINRTFSSATGTQGFGVTTGSAVVRAIKYHQASNRIFVGGTFQSYKGIPCSANIVCLNATTGAIISSSIFKIGIFGLRYNSGASIPPCVYDIQFDESDPTETKIVVAGAFNSYSTITNTFIPVRNLVRLKLDGTLDSTFAVSLTSFSEQQSVRDTTNAFITSSIVKTIYVDTVGDIYAGGAFYTYRGVPAYNIVKIKNDGDIAPVLEFDTGTGFLKPNLGVGINSGWHRPFRDGVAIYPSGVLAQNGVCVERIIPHLNGILVTGNFAYYNSSDDTTNKANGLIKLNTDGTRDMSFTIDTTTVLASYPPNTIGRCGYDISVLNDGSVLFAGYLTSYLTVGSVSKGYYVLNSNGTVNSTHPYNFTVINNGLLFFNRIGEFFL